MKEYKFGKCPVYAIPGRMYISEEGEKALREADPAVRKHAEFLLAKSIKQSMHDLCMDHIGARLEEIEERLTKMESK